MPDASARTQILQVLLKDLKVGEDVDVKALGKSTPGYVGADLKALIREAGSLAIRRIIKAYHAHHPLKSNSSSLFDLDQPAPKLCAEGSRPLASHPCPQDALQKDSSISLDALITTLGAKFPLSITMEDFLSAAKTIQPSAKREGFAVVPDISWKDVGALSEARHELTVNFLRPISNPEKYKRFGLEVSAGVLFFGPPG